jgi:hypothetical protein
MYPPQKFMMSNFAEVSRAVISPSRSALSKPIYQPARTALPEPLASRTCAEGHLGDDFRRVVRSATVILGPKACMGVILVKSGECGDRLPI